MSNQKTSFKSEEELQKAILQEKSKGTPDIEIGQKYGVTFRYIERLITKLKGINVSALNISKKVKTLDPRDFKEEHTTVWSFKQRGNWATHSGEYRGNWSPYIPRNVILRYSKPGELVLDYFCGAGTTAVEAKLLGRRCLALDINDSAIELAKKNIDFSVESQQLVLNYERSNLKIYEPELSVSDARDLSFLKNNSVDLICSHPPYANIIHYTDSKKGDLSFLDIDDFLKEMTKVAEESFRVLKPGRQCAILIGDTRRKRYVIPMGFKVINIYLDVGFKLMELVIKRQHNCKTTGFWYANSVKYNFLLLAHEYLPIFEKPKSVPFFIREKEPNYRLVVPSLKKLALKEKLAQIETTTVWILPEKNFDEHLNKNIIDRYSKGRGYSTISYISNSEREEKFISKKEKNKKTLFFIKSPFLNNNPTHSNIEYYLKDIGKIVSQDLCNGKKAFLVIQTRDVRIDGYIEAIAKRLIDFLTFKNLRLKEIIIITKEGDNSYSQNKARYLEIAHQYLLVYEVES
jgi:DNA modification methylase